MIGFKVQVTKFGGSQVDYTSYVKGCNIKWPATTALPTCTVEFQNSSGLFAALGLFGTIAITLPRGIGTFTFYYEQPEFMDRGAAGQPNGVQNAGHSVKVQGTAAPELIYASEGNLDVVGTDLVVGVWNQRSPPIAGSATNYVPYPSTFVSGLGTSIDIGTIFTQLLDAVQPNQLAAYRGRLGYDCTGAGMLSASDVDYTDGVLGYYVKGQWQVGLGATGSQKSGVDIIRDLCTKNVIDGSGNPNVLDWYVDCTQSPPLLKALARGSVTSGIGFAMGTDSIELVDLPIDSQDIRNFVLYWSNPENTYPNSGDAWSNYDTSPHLNAEWPRTQVAGTSVQTVSSTTPYGYGTSNLMSYVAGVSSSEATVLFTLAARGYAILAPARGLSSFNCLIGRVTNTVLAGTPVTITIADGSGHSASFGIIANATPGAMNQMPAVAAVNATPSTWAVVDIPIPPSGHGVWSTGTGWDFSLHSIVTVKIDSITVTGDGYYFDYIHFGDNWNYSPTYSFNGGGATACTLTATATAPTNTFLVTQTAGIVPGQYIGLEPGTGNEEFLKVSTASATTIVTTANSAITHNSGSYAIGATHDLNSISQFKYRIFSFVDFYVNSSTAINGQSGGAGSDTAEAVAYNILTSRKGKKSSGTITVSGYNQGVATIKPGSLFTYTDAKDVYTGGSTDSSIAGWIADAIEFDVQPLVTEGFKVTYTVEPYYTPGAIGATSPDSNQRNLYRAYGMAPGGMISRLQRNTQNQGNQP